MINSILFRSRNSPTEHELNLKVIESRAREELEKESERKRSRNKA